MSTEPQVVLGIRLQTFLGAILASGIKGGSACAYPARDRARKSRVERNGQVYLVKEDGDILVEQGLVALTTSGTIRYELTEKGVEVALPLVTDYEPLDIQALIDWILDLEYFHPSALLDGETAIPSIWVPGGADSKLVLVLGENAGGKSFFRRLVLLATYAGKDIDPGPFPVRETVNISMQGRTAGGITSAFIYGTENWQSTGEISAHTVKGGVKTSVGRTHPVIMYWDEPDIGMSASSAAGAGIEIREMLDSLSPMVQAVFVTSHSPTLVAQLTAHDPHYLYLGNDQGPADLQAWLNNQQTPTPIRPSDLTDLSHRRFQLIQKILNARKKERKEKKSRAWS